MSTEIPEQNFEQGTAADSPNLAQASIYPSDTRAYENFLSSLRSSETGTYNRAGQTLKSSFDAGNPCEISEGSPSSKKGGSTVSTRDLAEGILQVADSRPARQQPDGREGGSGEKDKSEKTVDSIPLRQIPPEKAGQPHLTLPKELGKPTSVTTSEDGRTELRWKTDKGEDYKLTQYKNGAEQLEQVVDGKPRVLAQLEAGDYQQTEIFSRDRINFVYDKAGNVSKLVRQDTAGKGEDRTEQVGKDGIARITPLVNSDKPGYETVKKPLKFTSGDEEKVREESEKFCLDGGQEKKVQVLSGDGKKLLFSRSTSAEILRTERESPDRKRSFSAGTKMSTTTDLLNPGYKLLEARIPKPDGRQVCAYEQDSAKGSMQQVAEYYRNLKTYSAQVNGKDYSEKDVIGWERMKDGSVQLVSQTQGEGGSTSTRVNAILRAGEKGGFKGVEKPKTDGESEESFTRFFCTYVKFGLEEK